MCLTSYIRTLYRGHSHLQGHISLSFGNNNFLVMVIQFTKIFCVESYHETKFLMLFIFCLFSMKSLTFLRVDMQKEKGQKWTGNVAYPFIGLIWFYGISTVVGHLMPNPFYTYILNIWFLNTFCTWHFETSLSLFFCTQLNGFTNF